MARDAQIRLGDANTPVSYTVPNAAEIIPKAITALFDGSGAAGTFLPAVEIVSDGGVVVSRTKAESSVSAGGSAEVTFAPFLRRQGGGSKSAGGPAQWASLRVVYATPPTVAPFPSAGNQIAPFDFGDVYFETSDTSVFAVNVASHAAGGLAIELTPGSTDYVTQIQFGVGVDEPGGGLPTALDPSTINLTWGIIYDGLLSSADPNSSAPYLYDGRNLDAYAAQTFYNVVGPPNAPDALELVGDYLGLTSVIGGAQSFVFDVHNVASTNPTIELLYAWLKITAFPASPWAYQQVIS